MKTIRVTFRNYSPNGKKRMLNILKKIYWINPPADWESFDENIKVTEEQSRGGDCFTLIIDNEKFKAKWIVVGLRKIRDIRAIEKMQVIDEMEKYIMI